MHHHITTCDYEKKDQLLNAWNKAKYKNTLTTNNMIEKFSNEKEEIFKNNNIL